MRILLIVFITVFLSIDMVHAQYSNPFTRDWASRGTCDTVCDYSGTHCRTVCN